MVVAVQFATRADGNRQRQSTKASTIAEKARPMSALPVSTRVLAGVLVASAAVTAGLLVSPSSVVVAVESLAANPVAFGMAVAGLYLVRPLFAWPTTPLAAVVGYGYGIAMGVPFALGGVVVTVTPVFLGVRIAAGDGADGSTDTQADEREHAPESPFTGLFQRTNAVIDRYYEAAGPLRGVTASRLAPVPSDLSTCAAAVSGVSFRTFVLGTLLGELPWTLGAVVVGASAGTVATDGVGELGLMLSVACCLAVLCLLAGPVYRVVRSRQQRSTGSR
ncbi:hypothetical protein C480_16649 [Natrialba aegyptia DSM 13077]|uniref:VTT domain-containing protein n=2 Tax=Natrialba aegyptia TaxID=129789 RepID=M0AWM9_9EURY|nr:hypothetical protein C480_16649 [Natrialba aegyptia DSM 13077]